MGQRLNIQIEANNTDTNEIVVLANCYYHRDGYTSNAMKLVNVIVNSGIYNLDILGHTEKAIRLLHATGAVLLENELKDTYNTDKYMVATNRNDGLIAISEKGTNRVAGWEESRVTINLTTGSINMSDMFYDETDEFSKEVLETKLKNLYELKADLNSSFDTFHALYSELTENVFDSTDGCDMFVQEDCIYRTME